MIGDEVWRLADFRPHIGDAHLVADLDRRTLAGDC